MLEARQVAARFLAGYLPFAYGRGSALAIRGITPVLRRELLRRRARLTPVERHRRPRVMSLQTLGTTPAFMVATALIDDGGVTVYRLRFTLQREAGRWAVSSVAEGEPRCRSSRAGGASGSCWPWPRGSRCCWRRRGAAHRSDRPELHRRRGRRCALAGGGARHPLEHARDLPAGRRPVQAAVGDPGRDRQGGVRPRPLPDPSCTPQPGAKGPGVANFAGASGPMQVGIGGAAGDEYDALRHFLPNPSLGPHDPTTAVEFAALVLIKDKGAPTGQPIDAYRDYARAYNGAGPMAEAYAARVLADAHAYQGAGRISVAAGCSAAVGTPIVPGSRARILADGVAAAPANAPAAVQAMIAAGNGLTTSPTATAARTATPPRR